MSMYLIIIFVLLLMLFLNIKLYKFDVLSPSFLYSFSMLVAMICSFVGLLSWNDMKDLSSNTALIIILSVIAFNIGEFIVRKLYFVKSCKTKIKNEFKSVPTWKVLIQLVFVIICFILVLEEVLRISNLVDSSSKSFFETIKVYRSTSILFSTKYIESGIHINIIVAQLQKIAEVICYINIYMIVNSLYRKKFFKDKKNILHVLIILICISMSLLIGSRLQLLVYILSFVIMYIILLLQKYDFKKLLSLYWKQLSILVVAVLSIFYVILPLTGRKTETNLIEYTSFYFGSSISSLQKYMDRPAQKPKFFGEETFRGVQNIAYKLKLSKYIQSISTSWEIYYTKSGVKLSSNIYTSSKRYYHDFGYLGVIICQLFNGLIFALIYVLMRNKKNSISIIFYSMYLYMIMDQIRDEYLFSSFIHINTIFKLFVLIFIILFMRYSMKDVKYEIKNRKLN